MVNSEISKDNNYEMVSKISKDGLKNNIKIDQLIAGMEFNTLTNYKCQLCNKINFDFDKFEFLQCRNGDYCCNDCWILSIEEIKECKICKSSLTSIDQLSRNKFMENEFKKTSFKCPYSLENSFIEIDSNGGHVKVENSNGNGNSVTKGDDNGYIVKFCNEIVKFESFNQHILECSYQIINCDHCNCKLQRIDYQKHLDQDCESLMAECQFCNKNIQCIKLSNHHNLECEKYFKECSNKCGQFVKISNLQNHLSNECPESSAQCPIAGCTNSTLKRSMLSNHTIEHLNNQITFTNGLMNKYLDLENKISQLTFKLIKEPIEFSNNMFIDTIDFCFYNGYKCTFRIHGIKFYFHISFSNPSLLKFTLYSKKVHKNIAQIELEYTLKLITDKDPNLTLSKYVHIEKYIGKEQTYTLGLDNPKDIERVWTSSDKKFNMNLHLKIIKVDYINRYESTIPTVPFQLR